MRVLLYDKLSERYFRAPGGWTRDMALASDFVTTVQAVNAVFQNRLRGMEIIMAFEDRHVDDMRLPVTAGGALT